MSRRGDPTERRQRHSSGSRQRGGAAECAVLTDPGRPAEPWQTSLRVQWEGRPVSWGSWSWREATPCPLTTHSFCAFSAKCCQLLLLIFLKTR